MERKKRRIITGLAVTGVLAGALAGGGVALANPSGAAQPIAVTAVAAPAASTAVQATVGKGGARFLRRAHAARLVLRTAAGYLGITPAQLRTQLRAGKSLAAVAVSKGKSVSGLENAILAAVVQRVDDSKLTAARKAAVISDVKNHLSVFVTEAHPFHNADRRLGKASGTAAGSATQAAV